MAIREIKDYDYQTQIKGQNKPNQKEVQPQDFQHVLGLVVLVLVLRLQLIMQAQCLVSYLFRL